MKRVKLLAGFLALAVATPTSLADGEGMTDSQRAELGQYFGFGPMQIYRVKRGIDNLILSDLNGDKRTDMLLWNGQQSRFEFFFQPADGAVAAVDDEPLERNELPSRGMHRRENVPVNYNATAVEVGDVTGDGRPDIVFLANTKELVVLPQTGEGEFGTPDATRAPDSNPRRGALALGDFNGDSRIDAAVLGAELLLVYPQRESGGFAPPVRLVHGIRNPTLMLKGDIDGDGRDDLLIGADDERYAVYVCLQKSSGELSALRPIRVPRHRSMTLARPVAGRGDDVYCVELATNRLVHYRWQLPKEGAAASDWPLHLHSYPVKSSSKMRPLSVGDINGDGRADVVALDPDGAQIMLYLAGPDGLGAAKAFPGLLKASDVQIVDLDRDGANDVLVVSSEEKLLAAAHFKDGRLEFPRPMPTTGEPHAAAAGALRVGGETDRIATVTEVEEEYKLVLRALGDEPAEATVDLDDVDEDPTGVRFADLDQDGKNDLLVFVRFAAPLALIQQPDGSFTPLTGSASAASSLKAVDPAGFALADVTGDGKPEVLLAQESFVRAYAVREGRWTVVDQYNPESADARISGVAVVPENGRQAIVVYERKAGDLLVFRQREDKTYAVSQSMPVGAFDLSAMGVLPAGDGKAAVLMADAARLAVLRPQEQAPTLAVQHTYESDKKDAWLADAVVGDLNRDGVRDVAAVDMGKAGIEILTTPPGGGFVFATRFQVFQGRRFSEGPDTRGEPREVLVGDVSGDGVDDIALLVHDRLIVYPGE